MGITIKIFTGSIEDIPALDLNKEIGMAVTLFKDQPINPMVEFYENYIASYRPGFKLREINVYRKKHSKIKCLTLIAESMPRPQYPALATDLPE